MDQDGVCTCVNNMYTYLELTMELKTVSPVGELAEKNLKGVRRSHSEDMTEYVTRFENSQKELVGAVRLIEPDTTYITCCCCAPGGPFDTRDCHRWIRAMRWGIATTSTPMTRLCSV